MPKLHDGYKILPPFDYSGARYDWCDPDEPGVDPLHGHSINCQCLECVTMDFELEIDF